MKYLLILFLFLTACADVKVLAPHPRAGNEDTHFAYGLQNNHPTDEPVGVPCETITNGICHVSNEALSARDHAHDAWVKSHTITIPVGKCIAADMGTTAAGYLLGFHEGGIPIAFKAGITWWQIQASIVAARTGNLSIAKITALTHCTGALVNVTKFVK